MSNFCILLLKMTPFLQNVQYIKSKKSKFFVGWTDRILSNPILVTPPMVYTKMWHVHFLRSQTLGLAPSLAAPCTEAGQILLLWQVMFGGLPWLQNWSYSADFFAFSILPGKVTNHISAILLYLHIRPNVSYFASMIEVNFTWLSTL